MKTLVLTFPFSNAGFAVVLPAENQECLLEGMKELFRQAGGIPRKIRIDNMSTAVTKVKSKTDPAVLTDGFYNSQLITDLRRRYVIHAVVTRKAA